MLKDTIFNDSQLLIKDNKEELNLLESIICVIGTWRFVKSSTAMIFRIILLHEFVNGKDMKINYMSLFSSFFFFNVPSY